MRRADELANRHQCGGKGKTGKDGGKKGAGQWACRGQSWRCGSVGDEWEEEGARGAWPVGSGEEVGEGQAKTN